MLCLCRRGSAYGEINNFLDIWPPIRVYSLIYLSLSLSFSTFHSLVPLLRALLLYISTVAPVGTPRESMFTSRRNHRSWRAKRDFSFLCSLPRVFSLFIYCDFKRRRKLETFFFWKGGPYHRFDPLDEKCIEKVCLSLSFHGERNWRNVALSIKRSLFHSIDRCVCTADVFDGSLALPAAPFFIEISYGRWYLRTETARIAVNELSCCFCVSWQSGWTSRTDRNRWRSSGGRRGSLKWPNPIWISSVSLFVSN